MKHQIGLIGWRGMVGSVLLDRMLAERDFDLVEPVFFSTSQAGRASPDIGRKVGPVQDANDLAALARLPMLISTQGAEYTLSVHARLRAAGWQGYWIDAASTLRTVSYTHLRAHETRHDLVCRLLLEKKK